MAESPRPWVLTQNSMIRQQLEACEGSALQIREGNRSTTASSAAVCGNQQMSDDPPCLNPPSSDLIPSVAGPGDQTQVFRPL